MMAVLEELRNRLSAAEWQAVKSAGRAADATRNGLEVGDHDVDLLLRIKGQVTVGEDGESTRTVRPTAVELLSWILSEAANISIDGDLLLATIRSAAERSSGRLPEVEEGYAAQATMAIGAVSPSRAVARKGAVRGNLRVGVVNASVLSEEVSGAVERSTRLIDLAE